MDPKFLWVFKKDFNQIFDNQIMLKYAKNFQGQIFFNTLKLGHN